MGVSEQCDQHLQAFGRPTGITMPTFLPPLPSEKGRRHDHIPFGDYFRKWQSMGENFKAAFPFRDYCQLRQEEGGRNSGGSSTQSSELQRTTGRTPFPMYDGSTDCTVKDRVEKLDASF